jgi:hypothetical protein
MRTGLSFVALPTDNPVQDINTGLETKDVVAQIDAASGGTV